MIIDFHTHLGHSYDGSIQSLQKLKKNMKKYGISKSVVFPIDDKNMPVKDFSLKLLTETKKDSSLIPFLRFDPKLITSQELDGLLNKGFYGVKLHPRAEQFDPLNKKYFPLYKVIARRGKPLLLHVKLYNVTKTDPMRAVKLGKLIPNLKLVIAHFANSHPLVFDYVKEKKLRNVYFDTSVNCTQYYITIGKMIGFDKILFGSDCPYSDQEVELLKIKKLPINKENKEKVLGLNAQRILGL